ncbi:hypothetical protein FPZ12_013545 [Amycolatopsis acidicola]|uniref:DUF2867 domain-containing protein n=1 Tax=Amycolatopsis acidicola TaxID=2596893 RepID=A0A5N0V693_9PSEU|nr:hypothetical protein [Amycolatopsis acidicola]KAA9161877.1 hypothetical protein FPZ12_013545 [Amycolatopsis acidicola]
MTVEHVAPRLLDQFAPSYDFVLREHLLVDTPATRTTDALRRFGSDPAALFGWAFGVPMPLRPNSSSPGFDEILSNGQWTVLGERAGQEVVLGTAGRFWTSFSDWQRVSAQEFPSFRRPRRGTIAIALSYHPYHENRTLLTFEARAKTTDEVAYRWADWYWEAVKPTARLVVRQVLRRATC